MPTLADSVSNVTPLRRRSHRSERGDFVKWSEFEPYLNQLRTSTAAPQSEMAKLMGYNGGSPFSTWKKEDVVPMIAFNSIRWCLHELKLPPVPKVEKEPAVRFEFEELADLFAAVRNLPVSDESRKALIRKIAKAM